MASGIASIQFRETYAKAINLFNENKSITELQDMEQKPIEPMQLKDTETSLLILRIVSRGLQTIYGSESKSST